MNRWPLNLTLNKQETNTPVYVYYASLFDACLQETNVFYSHRGKITSKKPDLHSFLFLKIRIKISIKKEMEVNFCTLHKSTETFTFFERLNTSPEVDVIFKRVQHVLNGIEWYF